MKSFKELENLHVLNPEFLCIFNFISFSFLVVFKNKERIQTNIERQE